MAKEIYTLCLAGEILGRTTQRWVYIVSVIGSRRRLIVGIVFAVLLAVAGSLLSSPASADTDMIDVPLSDTLISGKEGDVVLVGGADVAPEFVGRSCTVEVVVTNQSSVHEGNSLIVTSGDSSTTVEGIEDTADAVTTQGGTLTLGETVSISIKLGPSGGSSVGSNLTVTCEALEEAPPAAPVVTTPEYTG